MYHLCSLTGWNDLPPPLRLHGLSISEHLLKFRLGHAVFIQTAKGGEVLGAPMVVDALLNDRRVAAPVIWTCRVAQN